MQLLIGMLLMTGCVENNIDRGNRNLALGDYERAKYFFSKVVDTYPENFEARLGLGKACLQQLASTSQNNALWNLCLINLEAARTLNPDQPVDTLLSVVWHQRAMYLLESRDSIRALQALMKSIEYDRTNAKPLNAAGLLYFKFKEYQKAFSLFTLVANLDTLSPVGYFNAGIVSWTIGNCVSARQLWLNALNRFPDNNDLLYWAAMAEKTCPQQK